MLTGRFVTVRDIQRADLPVIHRELDADVDGSSLASGDPWRPPSLARREAAFDRALAEPLDDRQVRFAVEERGQDGPLVGTAGLWWIDLHNGLAHIGIHLAASGRGRGLGTDVVRVMCHYAFVVRGLHRLGLETLSTNGAMRRTAVKAGFTQEGVVREAGFILGERVDEVLYGILRSEWQPDEAASG